MNCTRMITSAAIAAALMLTIAGCAQQQASQGYSAADFAKDQQASYDRTRDGVAAMITAGEITPKQGAQRMATYVRTAMPQDFAMQDLWNYSVLIFSKQEKGEISSDEAGYLIQKKAIEHEQNRQASIDRHNAAMAQQNSNVDMTPYFLMQGVGGAFQNAYRPAGQKNCTTTSVGGVYSTNCY